jgi:mono/diheme cytochrome c family protein
MATLTQTLAVSVIGALAGCGITYVAMTGAHSTKAEPTINAPQPLAERTEDGRLAVYLTAEERAHVREEMIAFLQGVQTASYALADSNRDVLRETAQDLSKGAGEPIGRTILQKVPAPFREMSQTVRREFGALADMADEAPVAELQLQFSTILSGCAACHGSYAVVEQQP